MAILKSFPWLRERVRIQLTEWGYDVQVYSQTVMRTGNFREATRFAVALRRALTKKQPPAAGDTKNPKAESRRKARTSNED